MHFFLGLKMEIILAPKIDESPKDRKKQLYPPLVRACVRARVCVNVCAWGEGDDRGYFPLKSAHFLWSDLVQYSLCNKTV